MFERKLISFLSIFFDGDIVFGEESLAPGRIASREDGCVLIDRLFHEDAEEDVAQAIQRGEIRIPPEIAIDGPEEARLGLGDGRALGKDCFDDIPGDDPRHRRRSHMEFILDAHDIGLSDPGRDGEGIGIIFKTSATAEISHLLVADIRGQRQIGIPKAVNIADMEHIEQIFDEALAGRLEETTAAHGHKIGIIVLGRKIGLGYVEQHLLMRIGIEIEESIFFMHRISWKERTFHGPAPAGGRDGDKASLIEFKAVIGTVQIPLPVHPATLAKTASHVRTDIGMNHQMRVIVHIPDHWLAHHRERMDLACHHLLDRHDRMPEGEQAGEESNRFHLYTICFFSDGF